jgi:hypothetical protein
VTVERSPQRFKLPRWAATLICIAALVGVYYAFQGINDLIAPAKFNPCGSINPNCAVHPATTTTFKPPTVTPVTPVTVQIVPLPPNPNTTPGGIPQPSFAPAP